MQKNTYRQLEDEQRTNKTLREKSERLENELERLSKVEVELESLQAEHARLKEELETLKWISSELSQLQQSYSTLEQEKAQLDKAHAQLTQNLNTLRQSEHSLRQALALEQETSQALHIKSEELTRDLHAAKTLAEDTQREMSHKIQQQQASLEQAYQAHSQLKAQYDELKLAEQMAKEGESRIKLDLTRDISTVEANLEAANAAIRSLEEAKATLEKELQSSKAKLEETLSDLLIEKEKSSLQNGANTVTEIKTEHNALNGKEADDVSDGEADDTLEDKKDEKQDESEKKDGEDVKQQGTDAQVEEKEKVPLSKKAKKKKAAAAAAAAAVTTTSEASKATESVSNAMEPSQVALELEERKKSEEALTVECSRLKSDLEERKAAEESLKAQIATLQSKIDNSREASESTERELVAAKTVVETLKDEKSSLSSSLEMHVDLTLQLQQELDDLKKELDKRQKPVSMNGAFSPRTGTPRTTESDGEEPLVRTRHTSSSPSDTKELTRDEGTQADRAVAADKAVQAERPETVEEGTQVNVPLAEKETTPSKTSPGLKDQSALPPLPLVENDAASSTNQSNREYLIKKHYEAKLQNVTEKLQLSDGRYVRLHREFEMLRDLLLEHRKEKEEADRAMEALR
ncbi:hypothetical protein BGZ94_004863, partial [Podila epigama]